MLQKFYLLSVTLGIFAYLGSIGYLLTYLRRAHRSAWIELGKPEISGVWILKNPLQFPISAALFIGFILGTRYRALQDSRVTTLVWSIRMLFVLCFILTIPLTMGPGYWPFLLSSAPAAH
jgi:hypothetical protein